MSKALDKASGTEFFLSFSPHLALIPESAVLRDPSAPASLPASHSLSAHTNKLAARLGHSHILVSRWPFGDKLACQHQQIHFSALSYLRKQFDSFLYQLRLVPEGNISNLSILITISICSANCKPIQDGSALWLSSTQHSK